MERCGGKNASFFESSFSDNLLDLSLEIIFFASSSDSATPIRVFLLYIGSVITFLKRLSSNFSLHMFSAVHLMISYFLFSFSSRVAMNMDASLSFLIRSI